MDRTPFAFAAFALGAFAVLSAPACKDNATVNEEPPLPGPGPVGMGGFTSSTGGSSAGGTGGASGTGAGGASGAGGGAGGDTMTGGMSGKGGSGTGGAGTGGASGMGGANGGAGGGGVACPSGGDAEIRFGNMIPAAGTVDFCLKSGATVIGPVFKCATKGALNYKELSKPLTIASGTYDILAVAGDCASAPLSTATGVMLSGKTTVAAVTGAIGVFPESSPMPASDIYLRFVHAIKGVGPVDVGVADSATLPSAISLVVFQAIPLGKTSNAKMTPDGTLPIDPNGYLRVDTSFFLGDQPVAVAPSPMSAGIIATHVLLDTPNSGKAFTAFAIGAQGDAAFPLAALLCDEGKTTGDLTACAIP